MDKDIQTSDLAGAKAGETDGTNSGPDIFSYLDYRAYLRDKIQFLQSQNRKYSQRWLAQKAGLKSPQLISMIISGQRSLSDENAQLLSCVFKHSPEEEEYLQILVQLAHTENADKQMMLVQKIKSHFQNGIFRDLPDEGFEYIRKWYYPAVRELTTVRSFEPTAKWIAKTLDISEEEADEAFGLLSGLGFIVKQNDSWIRQEPSLKARDFVNPIVMAKFHLQMLERSFKALHLQRKYRFFDSLTVAIPAGLTDEIQTILQRTIREIDMLAESYPKRDEVYQLNLQFFSLTQERASLKSERGISVEDSGTSPSSQNEK